MCQILKAGLKITRKRNDEMKSKRMWNHSSRSVVVTEKEYEVADILLDLPRLFSRPTSGIELLLSTPSWPVNYKRKRSALIDNKDDDVVDKNNLQVTTALTLGLGPSQSHSHSMKKPRRKSVFKNKTKEELLKQLDELTQCNNMLRKQIGIVRAYYEKILADNSTLKAKGQRELKKCSIEEGKTENVTKGLKNNAGTDTATVFPAHQHMSHREMDPSCWPHSFELEGRIGVDHDNKCQAAEAKENVD